MKDNDWKNHLQEGLWFQGDPSWDHKQINWFKFIWALIRNKKGFRWRLQGTIQYALRHHDYHRGHGASDVMLAVEPLDKLFEEVKTKD